MKQKTVLWDDASLTELKMFAAQVLGMTGLAQNIGEETLRAKIRQAYSGEKITYMALGEEEDTGLGDAPRAIDPSVSPPDSRALRGTSASRDPKVKITIAEVDSAGGKRAVFVGVNGVGMLVPRGRAVDIPWRYYHALIHAVKTLHEQDPDTQEIISSDVPSYPLSVNVMPPQAEIDAYLALEQPERYPQAALPVPQGDPAAPKLWPETPTAA